MDVSSISVLEDDYIPLHTALKKIARAAVNYDPSRGSAGKGAFESATISVTAFDAQLKLNFNLKFTPEELGAVLCKFDTKNTGEIDCKGFLIEFMRLGRAEKVRQMQEKFQHEKREETNRERWADSETARFANNTQAMLTPPQATDLQSALAKLRKVATNTLSNRNGCISMFEGPHLLVPRDTAGFVAGVRMTATEFKEQLRRNLSVTVTPGELAALMLHFDKDEDGLVSCTEFLNSFKRMGVEQRRREHKMKIKKNNDILKRRQAREHLHMNKLSQSFNTEFVAGGERALNNALRKIAAVAATYDPAGPVNLLAAFQGSFVDPAVLKEQLKLHFRIKLSAPELGALVQRFDSANNGTVNCSMLLNEFFRIRKAGRMKIDRRRKALNKAVTGRREAREKEATDAYIKHHQAKVVMPEDNLSGFVSSNLSMNTSLSMSSIGLNTSLESVDQFSASRSSIKSRFGDSSLTRLKTAPAGFSQSSLNSRDRSRRSNRGSSKAHHRGWYAGGSVGKPSFDDPSYDFYEEIPKLLAARAGHAHARGYDWTCSY